MGRNLLDIVMHRAVEGKVGLSQTSIGGPDRGNCVTDICGIQTILIGLALPITESGNLHQVLPV